MTIYLKIKGQKFIYAKISAVYQRISKAIKKTLYFVQKDGRLLYKLYKNI